MNLEKNTNILFSIIVPNYNGEDVILDCLKSIYKQTEKNIEIIVIDDTSTDKSPELLEIEARNNRIKLHKNIKNLGYSGSCFVGEQFAKGEFLIFMNSDAFFIAEDTLKKINTVFIQNPKLGVLGFNQRNQDMTEQFTGSSIDIFLSINTLRSNTTNDELKEVFMCGGACYVMKKNVYASVGGIDPTYFLYAEELDLMWRVQLIGYKVCTAMNIPIIHLGGVSTKSNNANYSTSSRKLFLTERNSLRTLIKNYSSLSLIFTLPSFFILEVLQIIYLIATGKIKIVKAYTSASLAVLKELKTLLKKRWYIQSKRVITDYSLFKSKKIQIKSFKILTILKKGVPKIN